MLKVRVIPTLLIKDLTLVKGISFNSWRRIGSVLPAIKVYNQRDVDELILVDISANLSFEELDYDSINEYGQNCFVPLTVGGGINNFHQAQNLLRIGADKVTINTMSFMKPNIISEIAKRHGSQCLVVSIDARPKTNSCGWNCYSNSGTRNTGKDVVEWAKEVEDRGAGEILLTSIEKDGTLEGYDLKLMEKVANCIKIPVIASGGAGKYQDMIDVVCKCGVSAVAAASMFHFTEHTPLGAKLAMEKARIPVRKPLKLEKKLL
jgi:cyclase